MVHYLDSETPEQRMATLARLDALKPPAREKLVEIADVDGSPVAVTQFISSFVDFSTWLDQVSPASAIPAPTPAPKVVEAAPGDFTRAFNKIEIPAAPPVVARAVEPRPVAPTPPPAPTPARAQTKPVSEFTNIFGKVELGATKPAPAPRPEVTPAPTPDFNRSASPPPPMASAPPQQAGEFTQLFQRISPSAVPPSSASPSMPVPSFGLPPVSEAQRPIETAPLADLAPPRFTPPSATSPSELSPRR